jgi:hypothetical protein
MDAGEMLLDVLRRDYDGARAVAHSASQSADRTRTFGLTLVAALIGVTLSTRTWPLGAAACFATLSVATVDAYFSWQYARVAEHLRRIEDIERLRFNVLLSRTQPVSRTRSTRARPRRDDDIRRLDVRLRAFKPGAYTVLKRFRLKEILFLQPYPVFRGLYVVAIAVCIAAGIGTYYSRPPRTLVQLDRPVTVRSPLPLAGCSHCPRQDRLEKPMSAR